METLKITKNVRIHTAEGNASCKVRIDPEVLNEVDELALATGRSYRYLVDRLVRFALQHVEVIDPRDEAVSDC